jgi:hypothetical protein
LAPRSKSIPRPLLMCGIERTPWHGLNFHYLSDIVTPNSVPRFSLFHWPLLKFNYYSSCVVPLSLFFCHKNCHYFSKL